MRLAPGPLPGRSRSTGSRSRRRGSARRSRSRSSAGRRSWSSWCVVGGAGGAYLYVHESTAELAKPKSPDVKKAATAPEASRRGPARDRARDRLRPPRERGEGNAVALGHADADPRRPAHEDDLAALVPPRPAGRDRLSGEELVRRQDQLGLRLLRSRRERCETVRKLTDLDDQLPDHRQLPRLQADRRQARRHLARRRPPLPATRTAGRTATRRSISSPATSA